MTVGGKANSGTLPRVLVLGGTREARRLVEALSMSGLAAPVTSLAGVTEEPAELPGELRVGGFGGVAGLTTHLWQEGYVAVVDATHPFARQISLNAAEACEAAAVPRLILERPPWEPALGESWLEVADETAAARTVAMMRLRPDETVFLALGRQRIEPFRRIGGARFLLRTVEPIAPPFEGCEVVVGRGPFPFEEEEALFRRHNVRVLVCRNSGGESDAKLEAARAVRARIVIIRRPPRPPAAKHHAQAAVDTVEAAVDWIRVRIAEAV